MDGGWDGWARINTDTGSGGIVGVFRQGGVQTSRMVSVPGLQEGRTYLVGKGPTGDVIGRYSGKELAQTGFEVRLTGEFDAALFEVKAVE
jgi:alpha-galactosidase